MRIVILQLLLPKKLARLRLILTTFSKEQDDTATKQDTGNARIAKRRPWNLICGSKKSSSEITIKWYGCISVKTWHIRLQLWWCFFPPDISLYQPKKREKSISAQKWKTGGLQAFQTSVSKGDEKLQPLLKCQRTQCLFPMLWSLKTAVSHRQSLKL